MSVKSVCGRNRPVSLFNKWCDNAIKTQFQSHPPPLSLWRAVLPWVSCLEFSLQRFISFFCCAVTPQKHPSSSVPLCSSFSTKSWYICQLTIYLMQQTLIATSERFFIRYCAAVQILPSLARSFREKMVQQRVVRAEPPHVMLVLLQ